MWLSTITMYEKHVYQVMIQISKEDRAINLADTLTKSLPGS